MGFCLPNGAMKVECMNDFNSKFFGQAMVVASGSKSHFMTADVWLQMLEQMISPALKIHRLKQLADLYSTDICC